MIVINKYKVAPAAISGQAEIDTFLNTAKADVSFEAIRAAVPKAAGLTDGEIHQALINLGLKVDV